MRIATAIRTLALTAALTIVPAVSHAGVFVSIGIGAPPVLPVYAQPICPAAGYIWTPGYWAYDEEAGYYWVPGAWVLAPYQGALWTPGYWGWGNGGYLWHAGYWGRHVGFYGGVNYGFGYFGHGYEGGRWNRGVFAYNRSVTNINIVNVHNVYNERVNDRYNATRVSYNGGRGGIAMRPNADEQRWSREQHTAPLPAQRQNEMRASQDRQQFANVNHGRPITVAHTQPVAVNRSLPVNNRPVNVMPVNNANRGVSRGPATMPNHTVAAPANNRPMMNNHATRPVAVSNPQRPVVNNPSFNRGPQQTYHPQAAAPVSQRPQMNRPAVARAPQQTYRPQQPQYRSAPRQMHQAPQQSRAQESHGGGAGHGGHGR